MSFKKTKEQLEEPLSTIDLNHLEGRFLALWRAADDIGRQRLERLVSAMLAGRVTLTLDEVCRLSTTDVEEFADVLPCDSPSDWLIRSREN